MALIPNLSLLSNVSAALKPSIFLKPVKLMINFRIMSYTLYQGTRIGLALKEALDEMEVGTKKKRFCSRETIWGIRILPLAEIPLLFHDLLISLN